MGRVIDFDNYVVPRKFSHGLDPLNMMVRGGVTSTNESGRTQKSGWKNTRVGHLRPKRSVSLLYELEFQACFHILNNIHIHLIESEALSSTDLPNNMMQFTKE